MQRAVSRFFVVSVSCLALAACDNFDFDLRENLGNGFDTSQSIGLAASPRPIADDRGVISYPNYQVAVARRGDTVASVASRVGLPADELAQFNGVPANAALRKDEILALPRRVADPVPTASTIAEPGQVDIASIAEGAIQRAEPVETAALAPAQPAAPSTVEPVRHKVVRGETAYSISRFYNVSVRSLAEWNGLGSDLGVREGQFLLIPVANAAPPVREGTPLPGAGSQTPTPPSASTPLPDEKTEAVAKTTETKPETAPPSPELDQFKTSASSSAMVIPTSGSIIRDFQKGRSEGIDIAASAGAPVKAAADGTVAAITEDTDQVPIVVIRHDGGLLTVYAQVDKLKIKKGDTVKRGETIASVRAGDPSFVHFEVRKGLEAVDPNEYLQN
ncbi:MAG: peptidoglycan DD-metalloendopeptidase family protein [Pseudomonadota bacterium]